MKFDEIKKLVEMINTSQLTEFQYQDGEEKIVIKKHTLELSNVQMQPSPMVVQATTPVNKEKEDSVPVEKEKEDKNLHIVTSPLVGTFYRAPNPDSGSYVKEGDRVKKGDPLCIVEAMKLMNVIEAEVDGVVEKIFCKNAHPVEYQSKIFAIRIP